MPLKIILVISLMVTSISFCQEKYNTEEHFDFENCAFVTPIAAQKTCYINIIDGILLSVFNAEIDSLNLEITNRFNLIAGIMIDKQGHFKVIEADCRNKAAMNLAIQSITSIEAILPLKDGLGMPMEFSFEIFKNYYLDLEGKVASGLPKTGLAVLEEEINDVPFGTIEKVPVYPGCDGDSNESLKNCMSKKLGEFIISNFNKDLANTLNLTPGIKRIYVTFKINKHGNVADVKVRGPHPLLEMEAIRVVQLIPQMIPGQQEGKVVTVSYALPLVFKVEETARQRRLRLKNERKKSGN